HPADVGKHLGAAADLYGSRQLRELRAEHLARVEPLRVMRTGVLTSRQAHDHDSIFERLHDDIPSSRRGRIVVLVLAHRLPRPCPFPLDCAFGRTVSSFAAAWATSAGGSAVSRRP